MFKGLRAKQVAEQVQSNKRTKCKAINSHPYQVNLRKLVVPSKPRRNRPVKALPTYYVLLGLQ